MDTGCNMMMGERKDSYKYYVIRFLQLPYKDIEELVCVPKSWISEVDTDPNCIPNVAYPPERSPLTKASVKKRLECQKEWKFYSGLVKYGTDVYKDAQRYIRAKSTNPPKQERLKHKKKLIGRRKTWSLDRSPELKAEEIQAKRGNAPIKLSFKRKLPMYFIGETNKKCTRTDNTPESVVPYNLNKTLESVNEKESHSMHDSSANLQTAVIIAANPTAVNSADDRASSQSSNESGNSVNIFVNQSANTKEENLLNRIESEIEQRLSESNAEDRVNAMSTLPTPSNQLCQVIHPVNKKPLPALKRCTPKAIVDKRNEPSKVDVRPHLQINTNTTLEPRFASLTNQSNRRSKYIHEESLQNDRGHSYIDPRVQRSREPITIESNTLIQSACYQRNGLNTSDMQNTPILTNQSQPIQNPYFPFYADYYNARIQGNLYYDAQGMLAQRSTEVTRIDRRVHSQSHAKNTEMGSSLPTQTRESSYTTALLTASSPSLYRSSNERDIFTEENILDTRAGPQRYAHNTSAVQNMMSLRDGPQSYTSTVQSNLQYLQYITNQRAYLSEHMQKMQPVAVNRKSSHHDPRNKKPARSSGTYHLDQRVCPQDFKKNTYPPPISQTSTLIDNSNQLPADSCGKPHPLAWNDLERNLHAHTAVVRPAGMRGIVDGVTFQNFESASHNMQGLTTTTNHTSQSSNCSSNKPFAPVLKEYLLSQDPALQAKKRTRTNHVDSRASRTVPYSSNSKNQLGQSLEHCNKTPIQPANGNSSHQAPNVQENLCQPMIVNGIHQRSYPQGVLENTPSTLQNSYASGSSNLIYQFGQSMEHCNKSPMPPVDCISSFQVPLMHETLSRPLEVNEIHQESSPQVIQSFPSAVQNSVTSANNYDYICQCSCHCHAIPEHSHQNSRAQESQIGIVTRGNSVDEQSGHPGSKTEKRPSAIENLTNMAKQSTNHSVEKLLLPTSHTAIQEMAEQISLNQNSDTNDIGQSGNAERVTANTPNAMESLTVEDAETSPELRATFEEALTKVIAGLFSEMSLSVGKSIEQLDSEKEALMDYDAMLKNLNTLMESFESKSNNNTAPSSKQKKRNKKKERNLDDDGEGNDDKSVVDDDDYNNSDEHETSEDVCSQRRPLVLPPEYNSENTRWTLKHRRASSKLTELRPRSRVYVDSIRLANCKRMSRDHKTFARMLLTEIFSQSALSVCSWTGAKAHAFTKDIETKPGLDPNARIVLLSYVEEYGLERGWGKYDAQSVLSSIRSKIQDIRAKSSRKA